MAYPTLAELSLSTCGFRTLLAVGLIVAAAAGHRAHAQTAAQLDLEQEAVRLADVWKKQRGEVHSAHIKAEYYHERSGRRSPDDIKALVTTLEQDGMDIGRLDLSAALPRHLPPARYHYFEELELSIDGQRRRVHSNWFTQGNIPRFYDAMYDGQAEVWYNGHSQQANLYPGRSPLWLPELNIFRTVPSPNLKVTLAADEQDPSLVRSIAPLAMTIDRATGLIRYLKLGGWQIWQIGSREYGRGICFPRFVVRYARGLPGERLEVLKITSADFNEPLPNDAFDVSLPAGATLVDLRQGFEKRRATRLQEESDNVILVADKAASVGRACQSAHELPAPHPMTECRLEDGRCIMHSTVASSSGQLHWHNATCTDRNCRLEDYNFRRHSALDLYANSGCWMCQVEFGENGLRCRQVYEYHPSMLNHVAITICQPVSSPAAAK